MKKILILGGHGLLGTVVASNLKDVFQIFQMNNNQHERMKFDISERESFIRLVKENNFDSILNLIGANNVDKCEIDLMYSFEMNIKPIIFIVDCLEAISEDERPHLVHISTDHVYSGMGHQKESSANPCNQYARSKLKSEVIARKVRSTILRTNFFGKSLSNGKPSFTDWIFRALVEKKQIKGFSDVYFSPLSMTSIAFALKVVFEKELTGIFNLGSHEGMSKLEFITLFCDELGFSKSLISSINSAELKLIAPRSHDMRMDSMSFISTFSIDKFDLRTEIKRTAIEYLYA